ncbi:hypothetical protein H8K35_06515 [Undibacterium sp. LX40W]|uniref:Uncharacterized protein n=1 Tax=Undibacterium nitidum TaxID=2762298 RepID=A0A923KJS6_9BURK|nr:MULTISPECIES: hypothetical protein [Undibacterium]MBC3879960.1 hypothetical protein [Undibacterium nitidum]MBC3891304.1 hypothetical protein [Undibacterium sp. LX40W]
MINKKRFFLFALLIGMAPFAVGFLQGLSMSIFFEAYGFYKSPADAAMNVRYVRWSILVVIGFAFYIWYLVGAQKKSIMDLLILFLVSLTVSFVPDLFFGGVNFSDVFSYFSLGHLLVALLAYIMCLALNRGTSSRQSTK